MATPQPYVKCTAVFTYVQNPIGDSDVVGSKQGGWTESIYYPGSNLGQAQDAFAVPQGDWCSSRAKLLGNPIRIVEQRYQIINFTPPLAVQAGQETVTYKVFTAAGSTGYQDEAGVAFAVRVNAVAPQTNKLKQIFRGVPDSLVIGGGFRKIDYYQTAIKNFFFNQDVFRFSGKDLSQTRYKIATIDAMGNVVTSEPTTFALGQQVQVLRTLPVLQGRRFGGTFAIGAFTDSTHFQLSGWTGGATTGGKIRIAGLVFWQPETLPAQAATPQATFKKVGRPFDVLRGRRSKRGR